MSNPSPFRLTLRDLPFSARLALAVFLASVGLGYLSALVNLHFAEASPGEALPTKDDVTRAYARTDGVSQLERLLEAHPSLPFNGTGSMRSAFTRRKVGGWKTLVRKKGAELKLDHTDAANRGRLR